MRTWPSAGLIIGQNNIWSSFGSLCKLLDRCIIKKSSAPLLSFEFFTRLLGWLEKEYSKWYLSSRALQSPRYCFISESRFYSRQRLLEGSLRALSSLRLWRHEAMFHSDWYHLPYLWWVALVKPEFAIVEKHRNGRSPFKRNLICHLESNFEVFPIKIDVVF